MALGHDGMLGLIVHLALGVVVGLFYVWAYSARNAYQRARSLEHKPRLRFAMANKILSLLLTLLVFLGAMTIVRAYQPPSWWNLLSFVMALLAVCYFGW